GELYCWGLGSNGRLGLGNTNLQTTPTKVGTTANWSQVSAGLNHTCAVNTDGELYCWGNGSQGRLGLSETISRTIPTQVGTASNRSQVSAGLSHTCAVNTDGELYCWGDGDNGRLGLGTINFAPTTPQLVNTPRTPTVAPVLANITLTGPAGVFGAGNIIPPLTFTNTGGDVQADGCAIDTTNSRPDLPDGLRAHPIAGDGNITCQISGIPTAAAAMTTYYLTATNALGTSDAVTVSFQVELVRPLLADITTEQSYTMGTAITAQTFTNTGHGVTSSASGCVANPTLPAGLTLTAIAVISASTSSCQIAGTPEAMAAKRTYVITATDATGGTDEARITITVA
ncbi:MAG: putative Ig domain-containing protein, partial [Proteobacteria bacterium]|nr:putative Ig domain-containing protein [Pseudomonadota bacterium]